MADLFSAGQLLLQEFAPQPKTTEVKTSEKTTATKQLECKEVIEEEVESIVEENVRTANEEVCPDMANEYLLCEDERKALSRKIPPMQEHLCILKREYVECLAEKKRRCDIWYGMEKKDCGPFNHTEKIFESKCEVECEFGMWDQLLPLSHSDSCVASLETRLREIQGEFQSKLMVFRNQKLTCRQVKKDCLDFECDDQPAIYQCRSTEGMKQNMCETYATCWAAAEAVSAQVYRAYKQKIDMNNRDWYEIQKLKCQLQYYFKADKKAQCIDSADRRKFAYMECPRHRQQPCDAGNPRGCLSTDVQDYPCDDGGELKEVLEPVAELLQLPCSSGNCTRNLRAGSIL